MENVFVLLILTLFGKTDGSKKNCKNHKTLREEGNCVLMQVRPTSQSSCLVLSIHCEELPSPPPPHPPSLSPVWILFINITWDILWFSLTQHNSQISWSRAAHLDTTSRQPLWHSSKKAFGIYTLISWTSAGFKIHLHIVVMCGATLSKCSLLAEPFCMIAMWVVHSRERDSACPTSAHHQLIFSRPGRVDGMFERNSYAFGLLWAWWQDARAQGGQMFQNKVKFKPESSSIDTLLCRIFNQEITEVPYKYTPFRRPSCQAREEKRKFSPTATSLRRRRQRSRTWATAQRALAEERKWRPKVHQARRDDRFSSRFLSLLLTAAIVPTRPTPLLLCSPLPLSLSDQVDAFKDVIVWIVHNMLPILSEQPRHLGYRPVYVGFPYDL